MQVIELKHYELNINKISPYLKDIIKNLENSETWKIQVTLASNFISSIKEHKTCKR